MNYWLRWTAVCGLGEFLGIGVAAGIGFGVVMTLGGRHHRAFPD
jgi:hypothetical protein